MHEKGALFKLALKKMQFIKKRCHGDIHKHNEANRCLGGPGGTGGTPGGRGLRGGPPGGGPRPGGGSHGAQASVRTRGEPTSRGTPKKVKNHPQRPKSSTQEKVGEKQTIRTPVGILNRGLRGRLPPGNRDVLHGGRDARGGVAKPFRHDGSRCH